MAAYLPRPERRSERRARSDDRRPRPTERQTHHRPSTWQYSCGLCQEDHSLKSCRRFRNLTPYQRYETVERWGYCRNCLARSYLAPDCSSLTGCRKCDSRHHTELHGAPQLQETLQRPIPTSTPFRWPNVFVPTAMVRVSDERFDTWKSMRALINLASIVSRIASSTFKRLGLRSFKHEGQRFTTLKIMSRKASSTWAVRVNALITDELPRRPYSDPIIEDPTRDHNNDSLADIDPRSNTPIDIELGADVYNQIQMNGALPTAVGDVVAYRTRLGYAFAGPVKNPF